MFDGPEHLSPSSVVVRMQYIVLYMLNSKVKKTTTFVQKQKNVILSNQTAGAVGSFAPLPLCASASYLQGDISSYRNYISANCFYKKYI